MVKIEKGSSVTLIIQLLRSPRCRDKKVPCESKKNPASGLLARSTKKAET